MSRVAVNTQEIIEPIPIRANILGHNHLPPQASCSLSRLVRSRPINRKALAIVEAGPNMATERLARTAAPRYIKTYRFLFMVSSCTIICRVGDTRKLKRFLALNTRSTRPTMNGTAFVAAPRFFKRDTQVRPDLNNIGL